jgi:hypothetical protein
MMFHAPSHLKRYNGRRNLSRKISGNEDVLMDIEVSGLRVMNDNGIRALLWDERVLICEADADPLRHKQLKQLGLILEVGTCRVTKAVPRTLVSLGKKSPDIGCVLSRNSQFHPYFLVPQFGQRLGGLNTQSMEV